MLHDPIIYKFIINIIQEANSFVVRLAHANEDDKQIEHHQVHC